MNYDLTGIPKGYDRGRDHGPEFLELWMAALAGYVRGRRIRHVLDLGCGTGRFTEALARQFGARVVGVDPSTKMLEQALAKCRDARVDYVLAPAETIPLPDESVDMVFMSMSYHHFTEPARAARECSRVLRRAGTVFVRTGTRERSGDYPYVRFLPQTKRLIEDALPDVPTLRRVFETAGFASLAHVVIPQVIARGWPAYADKLSSGADSVLARLSVPELEAGLAAMRRHSAAPDEPIVEPIDLLVFRPTV